jgi:uncharacterized surface protein with fasciclin (FAS1) repeats
MIRFKYYIVIIASALILLTGCDEWDDHNKPSQQALNESLLQTINKTPELSKFSEYLTTTGYDQVLASSKTFTVWAPNDQALEGLSADITNDVEKLKNFIGNHISYQEYFTASARPSVRIKMVNGKNLQWYGDKLETVSVITVDLHSRNGVLHIIDQPVMPRLNNWDILLASSAGQKQSAYLKSLTYEQFVDSLAHQTGIEPATGKPIYEPGTGIVIRNKFLDEVYNIANEDSLCTLIILTDDAYNKEFTKLTPYFKTVTLNQDSTTSLASWHLTKDLVIKGVISPEALPDTLLSRFGVKVPMNKSAVVETYATSNGMVYVMSKVDFRLKDKFPPIFIQGERPDGFSRNDKNVNIHYRYRDWADKGFDLRVWNHGISQFYVRYRVNEAYSMSYKVYWRTVNDFVDTTVVANAAAFQQKLAIDLKNTFVPLPLPPGVPAPKKDFGYVKVNAIKASPANNRLRYLGDYKHDNYRSMYLFVVSNNVTTPNTLNPIEVDYIKLVPIF